MNDLPFDPFESTARILKLDYDAVELSRFFEEHCFSQDQMSAVDQFLEYLRDKKGQACRQAKVSACTQCHSCP